MNCTSETYGEALREVVARCIHGVDRNDFAVELTKVALWIETVDPGKPLGFLGANIVQGDSLLGLFDKKAAAAWAKENKARKKADLINPAGPEQLANDLRQMPEGTLAEGGG